MRHNRISNRHLLGTVIMAIFLILCLSIGLAACQAISTGTPTLQGIPLSFDALEQQDYSGTGTIYELKNPGIIIVSSKDEVSSLKGLITDHSYIYLQTLNYDQYFVVGVFQGKKGSIEYGIQVDKIYRSENIVNILVNIHEPKPDQPVGEMITSPYHIVKVQKNDKWGQEITFNMVVDGQPVTSVSHTVP